MEAGYHDGNSCEYGHDFNSFRGMVGILKLKAFAVLFCSRAKFTERSIFGAVGGI